MPITQSPMDIRIASSARNGLDQAVGLAFGERDSLRRDRERLSAENARLSHEIERLRQENQDLRAAAEIWIRLYENQLSRANRTAELLAHCAGKLSQ
jgi:hypothetical protein